MRKFSICNAPAIFQYYIDWVIIEYMNAFAAIYLDANL